MPRAMRGSDGVSGCSRKPISRCHSNYGNCVTLLTTPHEREILRALAETGSPRSSPQVSADTFKRWFSAVELIDANEEALVFRVPNNIYQFWIESNHMAALQAAIMHRVRWPARSEVFLAVRQRRPKRADQDFSAHSRTAEEPSRQPRRARSGSALNPRNTFDIVCRRPQQRICALGRARGRAIAGADLQSAFRLWRRRVWARPI